MKILLVEDHADIAGVIFDYFELLGHTMDHALSGTQALNLVEDNHYDVIILDVMLPKMNGMQVAEKLRENGVSTPILMLTALNGEQDLLDSFGSGVDDFVTKPFQFLELEARLGALIKRNKGLVAKKTLSYGQITLDEKSRTVSREGRPIILSSTLFDILRELVNAQGEIVTRESLTHMLWGNDTPDTDLLRSHIYLLRNTLDKPFEFAMLRTVPRHGYQLTLPNENSNH